MPHLQLVRADGGEVPTMSAPRRVAERILHLPALDLPAYVAMLAEEEGPAVLMRRTARIDARRFVRHLRARSPVGENGGLCLWNLVGDLLCHLVPIATSAYELEQVADGLRLVVRHVLDGAALGAGMMVGGMLVTVHSDGESGTLDLSIACDDLSVEMRFDLAGDAFRRIA